MGEADRRRLNALLAEAARNTGGRPVEPDVSRETPPSAPEATAPGLREAVESPTPPRLPTAYAIAVVIVEAAYALRADPMKVATGGTGTGMNRHAEPRARAYAATALAHVFPLLSPTLIGRYVRAPNPGSYLANLRHGRKTGTMRWWDPVIAARVIKALREAAQ